MYIPSNYSFEEIVKYFVPRDLQETFTKVLGKLREVEGELQVSYGEAELLEEQSNFRAELLEEIQLLCKQTGSKKELVKSITLSFENSYVELYHD